jgi:GNAT superfamily N-acetyltransferase
MSIEIRRANPDHAEILTQIAHTAKRHWGYPERWIEAWKDELTLTPGFIAANPVYGAFEGEAPLGFYALQLGDSTAALEHMWVLPDHLGNEIGRQLFEHAARTAIRIGARRLEILSDPNASGFYDSMGAVLRGERRGVLEGKPRVLPFYVFDLEREVGSVG